MPSFLGLPVISIRQPYARLVVNGIKDVENRLRRTHYRGPILIHASTNREYFKENEHQDAEKMFSVRLPIDYDCGGVIRNAEIVDGVRDSKSEWKDPGSWGCVLANARPLKFRECKGAVGFFHPKWK